MDGQRTIDAELIRKADVEDQLQNLELLGQCEQTRDIFETEHKALHDLVMHIMNPFLKVEYARQLQVIAAKQAVFLLSLQFDALKENVSDCLQNNVGSMRN